MSIETAKELGLKNVAFHLATAIGAEGHGEPAARLVRDGHHSGTLFCWDGDEWVVTDIENRRYVGTYKKLAVVELIPVEGGDGNDADNGLNQTQLGCDLDCGEYVVDADDMDHLRDIYGENLVVLWEQD